MWGKERARTGVYAGEGTLSVHEGRGIRARVIKEGRKLVGTKEEKMGRLLKIRRKKGEMGRVHDGAEMLGGTNGERWGCSLKIRWKKGAMGRVRNG